VRAVAGDGVVDLGVAGAGTENPIHVHVAATGASGSTVATPLKALAVPDRRTGRTPGPQSGVAWRARGRSTGAHGEGEGPCQVKRPSAMANTVVACMSMYM
jgi:hypothetical protein